MPLIDCVDEEQTGPETEVKETQLMDTNDTGSVSDPVPETNTLIDYLSSLTDVTAPQMSNRNTTSESQSSHSEQVCGDSQTVSQIDTHTARHLHSQVHPELDVHTSSGLSQPSSVQNTVITSSYSVASTKTRTDELVRIIPKPVDLPIPTDDVTDNHETVVHTERQDIIMSSFRAANECVVSPPPSSEALSIPLVQSVNPLLLIDCAACNSPIKDRYLLKALDQFWHEDCLKCSCCDCRLGEVGQTLYTKANLLLCKRDYLRLFGSSGTCAVCRKSIPAFEMVMKVRSHVYHLECFACQQCRQRFCVGDKFYLCDNRILCQYDFEEQNLITSIQRGYNALSHMRRQAETLSDISSGYGSPSPGTL